MHDIPAPGAPEWTPYSDLPPESFWRSAVTDRGPFGIRNLVTARQRISRQDRIVTAGSCFAQRLSHALETLGYNWLDAEPAPPMLSAAHRKVLNYGVFSFRTGNIYTTSMLRQWIDWAFDGPPADLEVWPAAGGRVQDPYRPEIEPGGFADRAEMERSRHATLTAIRKALTEAEVFLFTLGQTEAWSNRQTGLLYASCPGTVAGCFDPVQHVRVTPDYPAVYGDLSAVLVRLRRINPQLRVILTVSPVPLTATAEPGAHALVENTFSKSLLRAVAGQLTRDHDFVEYFPSYELVASPPFRGMFFTPNMRTVDPFGVRFIMEQFMDCFGEAGEASATARSRLDAALPGNDEDLVCHDYILEYYNAH